jgi:two-component system, OmpR family, phosphate regulon sensor histidine kinase PhoR
LQNWQTELQRLLLLMLGAGLAGWLLGRPWPPLLVALFCYALLNIYQLQKLSHWLSQDPTKSGTEPPEGFGIWGEIFDGIYRLQRMERKSSAHLESIIDKAQDSSAALEMAVVMIDKEGNIDWWNLASEQLLGFKYPQDKNQSVKNLIRNPRFTSYFQQEKYDEPLKLEAPGDSRKILEFQIALFGEHEKLMIVRDITQLQRLEQMRTDFVGNVSHELATPITVIKGYLEAILDNMDDLNEKWRKPIQQMRQQSMRMENIVRDLLMLTSLETKNITKHRENVDVAKLVKEIESDTRQMFQDKTHTFSVDCDKNALIAGNRSELYSAISNLVINAAKYTPTNGKISLTAYFSDDGFRIEVVDSGIEQQHIPRLTERFYRVDVSRSSETGGTGLGLAIVKHILARHGGELHIESTPGQGSRFSCHFPNSRVSRKNPLAPSAEIELSARETSEAE